MIVAISEGFSWLTDKIAKVANFINKTVYALGGDLIFKEEISAEDIPGSKLLEDINKKARENVSAFSENMGMIEDTGRGVIGGKFEQFAKTARNASDKLAASEPWSERVAKWWDTANQAAVETADATSGITDEMEEQGALDEKKKEEAGFMLTKAGRFALNQTPGQSTGGIGKDGWSENKVNEQLGLLKQLVQKQPTAVMG